MKVLSIISSILLAAGATAASAATITPTVTSSPGTIYNTAALTGYMTTGADMTGSSVTVAFAGGTSSTATWSASGNTSGGASAAGWSLTESGDTFSSSWNFTNTGSLAILGLTFNGVPGNTTFDIVNGPDDSPGSANGQPISSVMGPSGLTVAAFYTNELEVGGVFYGDEYTTMALTLGNGGLGRNGVLTFVTDTDNAKATGPGGGITPVPEPASFALLGATVLGVLAMRQRRRV